MNGGALATSTRYVISPYDIMHMPAYHRRKVPVAPKSLLTAAATTDQAAVQVRWSGVGGVSGYDVFRSTAHASNHTAAGATLIASGGDGATEFVDTDVLTGQTYWYYVVPQTSDPYARAEAVAAGSAVAFPAAGPVASRGLQNVSVQWVGANGADHYAVYRTIGVASDGSQFGLAADVPAGQTSWTDTATDSLTAYSYVVRAVFGPDDPTSPAIDYSGVATGYSYAAVDVSTDSGDVARVFWSNTDGASRYNVYRATDSGTTDRAAAGAELVTTLQPGETHFADQPPAVGQAYRYWVTAIVPDPVGAAGGAEIELELANSATASVVPVYAPVGTVRASDGTASSVQITWDPVPSAVSYEVYVGAVTAGPHAWSTAYHFTAPTSSSATWGFQGRSRFWVIAHMSDGSVQEVGTDVGATDDLAATDGTRSDGVRVTFGARSNPTPKWFEVYRSTTPGEFADVRPTYIGSAAGTASWYDDTTAAPGVTYYYWVYGVFAGPGSNAYLGIYGSEPGSRA
jgi:hypothetical protein